MPCIVKETLIQKICEHLNASKHGVICTINCSQNDREASYPLQILLVFDILASVLRIRCPSRANELHDICFYVRAVVDFLRSRGIFLVFRFSFDTISSAVHSSSECLESALGFLLALCKCSGGSFSWMSQLTSETLDSHPVLLFLITIEVELKLRLPAHLEGYLEVCDVCLTLLYSLFLVSC